MSPSRVLPALLVLALVGCDSGANEETPSFCEPDPCGEFGKCAEGVDGPVCVCEPGYASSDGGPCEAAVGVCGGVSCGEYGLCVDANGMAACLCDDGYVAVEGTCVEDIGEPDPCDDLDCGDHGACAVAGTEPLCVCDDGYVLVGGTCVTPPDPCGDLDCGEHGTCAVAGSEPLCVCDDGYVLVDGACVTPPDPCEGFDCGANGTCGVVGSTAVCICDPGYTVVEGICTPGEDPCEDIACSDHGTCAITTEGKAICVCEDGWVSSGTDCVAEAVPCEGVDCGTHGVCVISMSGEPLCLCDAGYEVVEGVCVAIPDPCEGTDCSGFGECVVDGIGSATCLCEEGYYLAGTDCLPNIDPCADTDCSGFGECVVTGDGPVCLCEDGYISVGADCEVAQGNPCELVDCNGFGTCALTLDGAPLCVCDPGYVAQGLDCVSEADPCGGVSCGGGGGQCVVVDEETALCLCPDGTYAVGLECLEAPDGALPESALSDTEAAVEHEVTGWDYVPMDLLVYAVEGHQAEVLTVAIEGLGAEILSYAPNPRRYIVRFPTPMTSEEIDSVRDELTLTGEVSSVLEIWVREPSFAEPNDTGWAGASWDPSTSAINGANWHLMHVYASEAWEVTTGSPEVKVGVVDFGVPSHPDLHVVPAMPVVPSPSQWTASHGVEVAGVLAAQGNNGQGLTGMLWDHQVWYCQTDGTETRTLACVAKLASLGVRIINLSYGLRYKHKPGSEQCPSSTPQYLCPEMYSPWSGMVPEADIYYQEQVFSQWEQELTSIPQKNWVLVQAAGNEAIDAYDATFGAPEYAPELRSRTLIVGASNQSDSSSDFSNTGAIDIYAPGGSQIPPQNMKLLGQGGGYVAESGTSFSAPIVAGAVALVLSVNPALSAAEAVDIILASADMAAGASPLLRVDLAVQAALETLCTPDCEGKVCGDGGCGGSCGECVDGEVCQAGICTGGGCGDDCGDEVFIPAGTFWMGCNEAVDDECEADEFPYHEVSLSGYWIDRTEVTQSAYAACVDAGVCSTPTNYWNPSGTPGHPVAYIDWNDAKTYCEWADKRLPTEAEWEKAARGTDGRKYPWGNEAATCEYAVITDGGNGCGGGTLPVCSKSPVGDSPYGLCDMAGNVWEWVSDWYDGGYYGVSSSNNPKGPVGGSSRGIRGGGFGIGVADLLVSGRGWGYPSSIHSYVGFRCARTPSPCDPPCPGDDLCVDGECTPQVAGTWTDPTTGLMWQVVPPGGHMYWEEAKSHCSNLTLAGGGWHLPTIGELRTLIRGCPATEDGGNCNIEDGGCLASWCWSSSCDGCSYNDGPANGCYWPDGLQGPCTYFWSSSPAECGEASIGWAVNFSQGFLNCDVAVMVQSNVRCVR